MTATDNAVGPVARAIQARRSVRAFTDQPVPDDVLRELLTGALRAPSGGNLQPWHIHVLTGDTLAHLKSEMVRRRVEGHAEADSHDVYPPDLWEPYKGRRFENGMDLYASAGIAREDRAGRARQGALNFEFFGAPVGLFFTIDRRMGPAQWIDLGIVMQTVALLAIEHGLASCLQAAWAKFPTTLADVLNLGEHERVLTGMSLGYEDTSHPVNQMRATRVGLDDVVTFHS